MSAQRLARFASSVLAFGSYGLVALAFNWPLPLVLHEKLTGPVSGDTGAYVWNLWVFRHEIVVHHRFPLFTQEVLSLTPPVDLSLHNYTLFADLAAFPLIAPLGVTAAFNVVYLLFVALTAWAMYELARTVVRRKGEAWIAGLLFGFSPVLIARSTAHFSLSAAAPLPLFVLALRRADRDRRFFPALLAGFVAGWASMWDAYYGVFCILIAACYVAARYLRVEPRGGAGAGRRRSIRAIDVTIVALFAATTTIVATGASKLRLAGMILELRPLHGPVLAIALLIVMRWAVGHRVVVSAERPSLAAAGRLIAAAGLGCTVALLPILYALYYSLADGSALHQPIYWRSSPPGVDLLSLLVPNPNSPWAGESWRQWLSGLPNGYAENVASVPFVGLLVVLAAIWRFRLRPARVWLWLAVFLAALALGPFVRIAGVDTHIPTPWTLLRYVPVIGATRTPARYFIPFMMAFSVLFARALARIANRYPRYRGALLLGIGALVGLELSPFPRPLYSASIPNVHRIVAADSRDVSVLNLPFGVRSGEWSAGNFNAASMFFQTVHEKRVIGGYLSRVGDHELRRQRESFTVDKLVRLSEGASLSDAETDRFRQRARGFVERARLGYVIVDVAATPPALKSLAIDAYGLRKIAEGEGYELYVPSLGTMNARTGPPR